MTHQMKIYFSLLGDHAHLRVFVGKNSLDATLGLSGTLVMSIAEFEAFRGAKTRLTFIPEPPESATKAVEK